MGIRRIPAGPVLLLLGGVLAAAACGSGAASASPVGTAGASPSPIATPSGVLPTPPPAGYATVIGHLVAGPTCPVEAVPPLPGCAPAPVADARVVATDAAGHDVAVAISKADGSYALGLAPGTYLLTPVPAVAMLSSPAGTSVTVTSGEHVVVDFLLDTGIR